MTTRTHNIGLLRSDRDEVPLSEIKVVGLCSRCFPGEDISDVDIRLVSPNGIVHESGDYGVTDCGHDATKHGWWWAL